VDITQEGYDELFEYDEGERLCGSTDATVTVTASVNDEQNSFRYKSTALPAYGISKSIPVHMMMNMIDHLKTWLPNSLPDLVLDLCEEGRARMEGATRTSKEARPPIPRALKRAVFVEAVYRCAIPTSPRKVESS